MSNFWGVTRLRQEPCKYLSKPAGVIDLPQQKRAPVGGHLGEVELSIHGLLRLGIQPGGCVTMRLRRADVVVSEYPECTQPVTVL